MRRVESAEGLREVSFVAEGTARSRAIRDFYSRWAEARGWNLVLPTEDKWSTDQWSSYGPPEQRTHQFTATWKSPDQSRSLSLAEVQLGDDGPIEVFLVLGPYGVIASPGQEPMTVRDLEQQSGRQTPRDLEQPIGRRSGTRISYVEAVREVARILQERSQGSYSGVEATYDAECRVVSLAVKASNGSKLPRGEEEAALESEIRGVLEALGRDDCPPERRFALTLLVDFEARNG